MQTKTPYILSFLLVLSSSLVTYNLQAAVITQATSELSFNHTYSINNGAVPQGIRIQSVPQSLALAGGSTSNVDHVNAFNEEASFVQVGNPFSTPPLPFEARRNNRTTFNAGTEGAQSDYDVSITSTDDPNADPNVTSIIERAVNNSGGAEVVLSTEAVAAQANSFYNSQRGYRIENTSNFRQAFDIEGSVSFDLFSQYEGENGFANASMSVFSLFENVAGVSAVFEVIDLYDPEIVESDPVASVFERLTFNEPNVGGFLLSTFTDVNAPGLGATATASISEVFRYRLSLIMNAGTQIDLFTGFTQSNTVEYDPQTINVNHPAVVNLFGFALFVLAAMRHRRR